MIDGREIYNDMQMTVHGMQLTIRVIVLERLLPVALMLLIKWLALQ